MQQYSDQQIRDGVMRLLSHITGIKPEQISDTASFDADLGLDSLSAAELMVSMEREYRVQIPQDEFVQINSVKQAVAATQRYLTGV